MASLEAKLDPQPPQALTLIFAASLKRSAQPGPPRRRAWCSWPSDSLPRLVSPPGLEGAEPLGRTAAADRRLPGEARGVLAELWGELAESANRILGPRLSAGSANQRPRPQRQRDSVELAVVDQLATRFAWLNWDDAELRTVYGPRERPMSISGNNLVCGSSYTGPLATMPPALFFRLVRRLALLPDRMGPLDGDVNDVLLFMASCCALAQVPGLALPAEVRARPMSETGLCDRVISRKERARCGDGQPVVAAGRQ